jgi:hypothetical protein
MDTIAGWNDGEKAPGGSVPIPAPFPVALGMVIDTPPYEGIAALETPLGVYTGAIAGIGVGTA